MLAVCFIATPFLGRRCTCYQKHRFWCRPWTEFSVVTQMGARQSRKSSSLFEPGYDRLVQQLVAMREEAGLTQGELADKLDRHRSFIWKTEGGQRRLDLIEFVKWCRACGADPVKVFPPIAAAIARSRP